MNSRMGLILCILCSSSGTCNTMFEGPGSCWEEGTLIPGFGIVKKQAPANYLNPADYQNVVKTTSLKLIKNSPKYKKRLIPAAYQYLFEQDYESKDKDILDEKVPFEIFFKFYDKEASYKI